LIAQCINDEGGGSGFGAVGLVEAEQCEDQECESDDDSKEEEGGFCVEVEFGFVGIVALAIIGLYLFIVFLISLDVSAAPIMPHALEMNPHRDDDDVGIADDCSVDADEYLEVYAGCIDDVGDEDEDDDVDCLFPVYFFGKLDFEHLEEADSGLGWGTCSRLRSSGRLLSCGPCRPPRSPSSAIDRARSSPSRSAGSLCRAAGSQLLNR
jgi:hypothetical protein